MKTSVRNRLAELLFRAFEDPRRVDVILWLRLICDLARRTNRFEIPLAHVLAAGEAAQLEIGGSGTDALADLIGRGKLFCLRRSENGEEMATGLPVPAAEGPWFIGPDPEVGAVFPEVCERAGIYAEVLAVLRGSDSASCASNVLRRTVAQAAACFNAGLFFEAHEHLEEVWRRHPEEAIRRLLQGIIQISVGYHHAQRGSYDGAVNQLTKGLEKTTPEKLRGEVLGLDLVAFLPAVARTRDAIVARGRAAMQPVPLAEMPRLRIVGMDLPHPGDPNAKVS